MGMDAKKVERLLAQILSDPALLEEFRRNSQRAIDRIGDLSASDREALRSLNSVSHFAGFKVDFSDFVDFGVNTSDCPQSGCATNTDCGSSCSPTSTSDCPQAGCLTNPVATAGGECLQFDATLSVQFDFEMTFPATTLTPRRSRDDD